MIVDRCKQVAESTRFDAVMLTVIVLNAIVLGAETFEAVEREHGDTLGHLNSIFLTIFVVELLIRLTAHWPGLGGFFRSGWNVFDFIVVAASFMPGLRENATLLRVARLLRIVRVIRFLPDLRVIVAAVSRSIPGVASLAVASVLLVYIYGMVGWLIFDDHDPEHFGNVGQAMLTMFVLLTLENLPTYIEEGQRLSDWTVVFFVSYVLMASFLVFNLFIGIVLNSMEEARADEHRKQRALDRAAAGKTEDAAADLLLDVEDKIDELRAALSALEEELSVRKRLKAEPDLDQSAPPDTSVGG